MGNHGKIMGKSWKVLQTQGNICVTICEIHGTSWEKHGGIMGKSWKMPKLLNGGLQMRKSCIETNEI